MREYDELTIEQQKLVDRYTNAYDDEWYAVVYEDGEVALKHNTRLNDVPQYGQAHKKLKTVYIQRCGE